MLKEGKTAKRCYRPVGDVFEYEYKNGNKVTLEVEKCSGLCEGCYFDHREFECNYSEEVTGSCARVDRWDETSVIFKEVKNDGSASSPQDGSTSSPQE